MKLNQQLINEIDKNKTYKINPEFDEYDTDTFKLASADTDGMYFHRIVDGNHEASEWAWFNNCEIKDGVLVEA